jgi:hypothetical protein
VVLLKEMGVGQDGKQPEQFPSATLRCQSGGSLRVHLGGPVLFIYERAKLCVLNWDTDFKQEGLGSIDLGQPGRIRQGQDLEIIMAKESADGSIYYEADEAIIEELLPFHGPS